MDGISVALSRGMLQNPIFDMMVKSTKYEKQKSSKPNEGYDSLNSSIMVASILVFDFIQLDKDKIVNEMNILVSGDSEEQSLERVG